MRFSKFTPLSCSHICMVQVLTPCQHVLFSCLASLSLLFSHNKTVQFFYDMLTFSAASTRRLVVACTRPKVQSTEKVVQLRTPRPLYKNGAPTVRQHTFRSQKDLEAVQTQGRIVDRKDRRIITSVSQLQYGLTYDFFPDDYGDKRQPV